MNQKEMSLVSVIIPSYNHIDYVEEAVLSAVNQTYENIELIVLDDGSTDGSVELLKHLAEQYGFSLVVKANEGLSATLNRGIDLSNGRYICVCASDDILVLDKIEKQVAFMEENHQYIMAYGQKINFYSNGTKRPIKNSCYRSGYIFKDLLLFNFFIPPVSVIYRKEVFDAVGGFDTDLAVEDMDMFLRIASKFEIGFQDDYFYYYRVHDANTIGNVAKMEENTIAILNKWKDSEYYADAIFKKNILYFRNYATSNKLEAIKRLPWRLATLKEKAFYYGMLLLVIPRCIYSFLRGA